MSKLSQKETESFINHIDECPVCKEELTIQFMVSEGLNKLEENGTFDLENDLDKLLDSSARDIRMQKYSYILLFTALAIAFAAVVTIAIIMI